MPSYKKIFLFLLFVNSLSFSSLGSHVSIQSKNDDDNARQILSFLPRELWELILYYAGPISRQNFSLTSKSKNILVNDVRNKFNFDDKLSSIKDFKIKDKYSPYGSKKIYDIDSKIIVATFDGLFEGQISIFDLYLDNPISITNNSCFKYPIVHKGLLYFARYSEIVGVDLSTRQIKVKLRTNEHIRDFIIIGEYLYISCEKRIYVIDISSRTILSTIIPGYVDILLRIDKFLYAFHSSGDISVIEINSNEVIHTIEVCRSQIEALAIDKYYLFAYYSEEKAIFVIDIFTNKIIDKIKNSNLIGSPIFYGDYIYIPCRFSIKMYDRKSFKKIKTMEFKNMLIKAKIVGNYLFVLGINSILVIDLYLNTLIKTKKIIMEYATDFLVRGEYLYIIGNNIGQQYDGTHVEMFNLSGFL